MMGESRTGPEHLHATLSPLSGTVVTHGRVDQIRPFGAFGKPIYQSHVQIRAMLMSRAGRQVADYFARPVYDPDNGELHWIAECPGSVMSASEVPEFERMALADAAHQVHESLARLIGELRRKGDGQTGGATAYAVLLEQAMRVPAEGEFLYFVGQQPVIAFWGFETIAGRSVMAVETPLGKAPAPPPPSSESQGGWLSRLWSVTARLSADTAKVPQTQGGQVGSGLSIPEGAANRGDLKFIQGLWQLGEGLLDVYRGNTDNVIGEERCTLAFSGRGRGHRHITERVEQGQPVAPCSGGARARFEGRKLIITWEEIIDHDGSAKAAGRMECESNEQGETICHVVNSDGHRWEAPLRQLT